MAKENIITERSEEEGQQQVPLYGFQDPSGEFPRKQYWGESSINKAARGDKINDLNVTATFSEIDLELKDTQPSQYPYNQVKETYSGHVIEYDDTAGGERILIKHRTGAGIEIRPDGTIYISSVANKLETVGGDMRIIVEGDTKMAYKGNVDMFIEGNYNVDVGGNYNIRTKGHKNEKVAKNYRDLVSGNREGTIKGNQTNVVGASRIETVLGSTQYNAKGGMSLSTEGTLSLSSDGTVMLSGKNEVAASSKVVNMTGIHCSVIGVTGSFGGQLVDYVGKTYMGPAGPVPFASGAAFYGNVLGGSISAMVSKASLTAGTAISAAALGGAAPTIPDFTPPPFPTPPTIPTIPSPLVMTSLLGGPYGIKTVTIDAGDKLKKNLEDAEGYGGVFHDGEPSTQDLRGAMRDSDNRQNLQLRAMADGLISTQSLNVNPPAIGRTTGQNPSSFVGTIPLGNTEANLGQQVTLGLDAQTRQDVLEAERDRLSSFGDSA
jgi:hypothetical protein